MPMPSAPTRPMEPRRGDELRRDNSPDVVSGLIKDATSGSRSKYVAKKYLDETRRGLASSKKIVPIFSRSKSFTALSMLVCATVTSGCLPGRRG